MRTRTSGCVAGESGRPFPLCRFAARFWRARERFLFGFGGGEALARFPGEFGEDKVVREAEERGEFLRREGVSVFERDPFCAREVGSGDDAGALGEIGEGFVGGFEGEENGSGFERSNSKHFAADFENEIVTPLDLLGGVGKTEAEFANGLDGIYGHGDSIRESVCRVTSEEGIGLPPGASGRVRGFNEETANDFLVERGGGEIFWLIEVVRRRVIAIGEPVLENFLFGRAGERADVHFDGGNAFDDEAILVAANEAIAERLLIGDGFDAERSGDGCGAIAEVGFFEAFYLEKFERNDGEKHVHVDVGDHRFCGNGGMRGKETRAKEALFFGGNKDEEERAAEFFGMGFQTGGDVEKERVAGSVVHSAVVKAVTAHGLADADVVEVGGEDDEFVFEGRIGAGKFCDEVGRFDFAGLNSDVGFYGDGERETRKWLAIFREGGELGESVAAAGKKFFGRRGIKNERELEAFGFVEFGAGEIHRRMKAIECGAGPRDIHGGGIEDGDCADGAGGAERFPALGEGAVVGGESGGDVRR